jgi:hypothetical protein
VLLPDDIRSFARLVKRRGLDETQKPEGKGKIAERIILLHEVISVGLKVLLGAK